MSVSRVQRFVRLVCLTAAMTGLLAHQGLAQQSPPFKLLTNGKPVTIYGERGKIYYLIVPSSMFDIETHAQGKLTVTVKSLVPVASSSAAGFDMSITSNNGVQYYSMPSSGPSKLVMSNTQFFVPSEKELTINLSPSQEVEVYQIRLSEQATYGALVYISFAPSEINQRPNTGVAYRPSMPLPQQTGQQHNYNMRVVMPAEYRPTPPFRRWASVMPEIGGGGVMQDSPSVSSYNFLLSVRASYGPLDWLRINGDVTGQMFGSFYAWTSYTSSPPLSSNDSLEETTVLAHASIGLNIADAEGVKVWLNPGYAYLLSTYYDYSFSGPSIGLGVYTHIWDHFNPEITLDFVYGIGVASTFTTTTEEIAGGVPQTLTEYTLKIPVLEYPGTPGSPAVYVGYAGSALAFGSYTRFYNNVILASKFQW
ncbi:MAG: hypothetical protein M1491_02795 [Deltaproteobacteria bacterium]|nr:hypothetical protein [Deltaproteobacteria bacterium]